jgi:hypothetical protein
METYSKLDGHRPDEMKEGIIYKGTPAGDFYKYQNQIYFKSAFNGDVHLVNPHPHVRFRPTEESSDRLTEGLRRE